MDEKNNKYQKITNFTGEDKFSFSREHSLLLDFLYENKAINETINNLKILEIGGFYGRDAIELLRYGDVTIFDIDTKGKEMFDKFLTEAINFLNKDYKLTNNQNWKLNDNSLVYENKDILDINLKVRYDIICSYNVLHRFKKEKLKTLIIKCFNCLKEGGVMAHIFVSDIRPIEKGFENESNKSNNKIQKHEKADLKASFSNFNGNLEILEYRHILEYDSVRLVHPHVMWYLYFKKYENGNKN